MDTSRDEQNGLERSWAVWKCEQFQTTWILNLSVVAAAGLFGLCANADWTHGLGVEAVLVGDRRVDEHAAYEHVENFDDEIATAR